MNFINQIANYKPFQVISELAKKNKSRIYIVGGYVRDLILEKDRNEIDFLVLGDGPQFAKLVAEKLGISNVSIFRNFGTAHFQV